MVKAFRLMIAESDDVMERSHVRSVAMLEQRASIPRFLRQQMMVKPGMVHLQCTKNV